MTTDFSKLRVAAHPDGRTAMRAPDYPERRLVWVVAGADGDFIAWNSDADLASEGFRPAHLLTDLTDSLIEGVETLGIPAWEAYPDGEIPERTPYAIVWGNGRTAVFRRGDEHPLPTRGYGSRRFLLAPPVPSRPEGAEDVQSALAAAGVEVTPEQADELAKAGVRAPAETGR